MNRSMRRGPSICYLLPSEGAFALFAPKQVPVERTNRLVLIMRYLLERPRVDKLELERKRSRIDEPGPAFRSYHHERTRSSTASVVSPDELMHKVRTSSSLERVYTSSDTRTDSFSALAAAQTSLQFFRLERLRLPLSSFRRPSTILFLTCH